MYNLYTYTYRILCFIVLFSSLNIFFFHFAYTRRKSKRVEFYLCCFKPLITCNYNKLLESVSYSLVVEHLFNESITELKAKFENHVTKELD